MGVPMGLMCQLQFMIVLGWVGLVRACGLWDGRGLRYFRVDCVFAIQLIQLLLCDLSGFLYRKVNGHVQYGVRSTIAKLVVWGTSLASIAKKVLWPRWE